MKSQISCVNWGQDESKVLYVDISLIIQWNCVQTRLAELFLAGREGSVLIAENCSVFTQEPQWAVTWWQCWKQKEPHTHHCMLYSLSFPEEESLLSDFELLEAERLSGSTLPLGKGRPWTAFLLCQIYPAFSSLYRQNNSFSLWKIQYLIKKYSMSLGFTSILIWIFTFHYVFKYFQGKVCSDDQMPGWLSPFLQFLLSYLERDSLLKKSNHYKVEKNFRLWKSLLYNTYFHLKWSEVLLRFFFLKMSVIEKKSLQTIRWQTSQQRTIISKLVSVGSGIW